MKRIFDNQQTEEFGARMPSEAALAFANKSRNLSHM